MARIIDLADTPSTDPETRSFMDKYWELAGTCDRDRADELTALITVDYCRRIVRMPAELKRPMTKMLVQLIRRIYSLTEGQALVEF